VLRSFGFVLAVSVQRFGSNGGRGATPDAIALHSTAGAKTGTDGQLNSAPIAGGGEITLTSRCETSIPTEDGDLARKTSQATPTLGRSLALPAELTPFLEPSLLLPGEDLRDFNVIRRMVIDEILPKTNVEWLWTIDLVDLSKEIRDVRSTRSDGAKPSMGLLREISARRELAERARCAIRAREGLPSPITE
jgi:hypothetical protein